MYIGRDTIHKFIANNHIAVLPLLSTKGPTTADVEAFTSTTRDTMQQERDDSTDRELAGTEGHETLCGRWRRGFGPAGYIQYGCYKKGSVTGGKGHGTRKIPTQGNASELRSKLPAENGAAKERRLG